jgi:hypothetical protein
MTPREPRSNRLRQKPIAPRMAQQAVFETILAIGSCGHDSDSQGGIGAGDITLACSDRRWRFDRFVWPPF